MVTQQHLHLWASAQDESTASLHQIRSTARPALDLLYLLRFLAGVLPKRPKGALSRTEWRENGACAPRAVRKRRVRNRALLGSFRDVLEFRVIADHDEVTTVGRRRRLGRVRRPEDRETVRGERKANQNAEGERSHIAVSLHHLCHGNP